MSSVVLEMFACPLGLLITYLYTQLLITCNYLQSDNKLIFKRKILPVNSSRYVIASIISIKTNRSAVVEKNVVYRRLEARPLESKVKTPTCFWV